MDLLSNRASDVANRALDGLVERGNAISSNLANVDTPNYKAIRVDFENELRMAIQRDDTERLESAGMSSGATYFDGNLQVEATNKKHLGVSTSSIQNVLITSYQDENMTYRNDRNSVDVESEMVNMTKNTMKYEALAKLQSKHYESMKEVIKGVN